MPVNIKNLDKTRLFIKLYNHIQTTSFGDPEKMIKDFEAGKLLLAQHNNDYTYFNFYCDITKDEVEPNTYNTLYGDGKNVFEDIVMELNKEMSLASTTSTSTLTSSSNTSEKELTKPADVILPFSTAAVNATTAKLTSAPDSKLITEENDIQKQAQALIDKLNPMLEYREDEYRIRFLSRIRDRAFEAPEVGDIRVSKEKEIANFKKYINSMQKLVKGLTIDTDERTALLEFKKSLETWTAPRTSRTAVMIGTLIATLDKQQVSAHKI